MSTKFIIKNMLVISDYNWLPDNIEESWFVKYTDNYLIYDRANRWDETDKIKKQINVGQNIYDIFDFIETNYDNLPDAAIFCRAAIILPKDDGLRTRPSNGTCSLEHFLKIANNEEFTEVHDFGPEVHNGHASFYGADGSFNEINNSWYLNHVPPRYFTSLNQFLTDVYVNPILPNYIRFAPGGSYLIPKKNMLRYSKNFYSKMKEIVGWAAVTGDAHMMERALYTIFTCDYAVKDKYK
jgi:hypothetical protein